MSAPNSLPRDSGEQFAGFEARMEMLELTAKAERIEWLKTLDPGISPYVDILDNGGVETFESCQGGDGHHFPEPTVRFYGGRAAGWHALGVALQVGPLPVKDLRRYWRIGSDGTPDGPNWEMTFSKTADDVGWAAGYVPGFSPSKPSAEAMELARCRFAEREMQTDAEYDERDGHA